MVRERLADDWIQRMYHVFENEPELSDREVADSMKAIGKELARSDYPAVRTVNKYHKEYNELPDPMKTGYRLFHWPECMESGLIPWEASKSALELLGHLQRQGKRPLVRVVRWYWRISQAAPSEPWGERARAARYLAGMETVGRLSREAAEPVEQWLAGVAPLPQMAVAADTPEDGHQMLELYGLSFLESYFPGGRINSGFDLIEVKLDRPAGGAE